MRRRILASTLLLIGVLIPPLVATSGDGVVPPVQWAVVNFSEPTRIADAIVMGPVLFVHDDRMYLGETCTSVYKFEPGKGPGDEIVSFHCIPRKGQVAEKFTMRTVRNDGLGCPILKEYQFAGDSEAHGVPSTNE